MKYQVLFSLENSKKYLCMLSAAVLIGALKRVNISNINNCTVMTHLNLFHNPSLCLMAMLVTADLFLS